MYKPFIICYHCGKQIDALVSAADPGMGGLGTGYMPMCSCKESVEAREKKHREEMERRKVLRRVPRRRR